MSKIIGIDFGTTNSCVAVMERGEPVLVQNSEGQRSTPSVVAFSDTGRLVGQPAKDQAITNAEDAVYSIKRFVGQRYSELTEEDVSMTAYQVVGSEDDVYVIAHGERYSPLEVSAAVLQKMKETAERYLGESVAEAVVAVPTYSSFLEREAIKSAVRIAGLDVMRVVSSATAAGLAYGLNKEGKEELIAVFDLGGGTFDISILQLGDGVFEVKSTNGDTRLGGDNFDQRVIDWLIEKFMKEYGTDLSEDRSAFARLREAAEKAKIDLSGREATEIRIPFIATGESGYTELKYTLSRSAFERMIGGLIEAMAQCCRQALRDSGVELGAIDQVVLVGGSTRIPAVQKLVQEVFGKEPGRGVNPDEAVAIGAAIQGGILGGDVKDVLVLEVAPASLGVETRGGLTTRLIERNTTIPTRRSQIFSTVADQQNAMTIHVVEGEHEIARYNRTLGHFDLVGIGPVPCGVPQIEVAVDIDANSMVRVSVEDLGTGKKQEYRVGEPRELAVWSG